MHAAAEYRTYTHTYISSMPLFILFIRVFRNFFYIANQHKNDQFIQHVTNTLDVMHILPSALSLSLSLSRLKNLQISVFSIDGFKSLKFQSTN